MASIKLCWEPTPRALYHQRENGPTAHIISYLDELAVCIPSLDAWDQMVWPTSAAILCALTEVELYDYCWGQAVDLGPIMPAAQFWVTEKGGAYLCTVRALVFERSILACNPAKNEAEWVPVCSLANDLSWAKERSAVALVNYVPCVSAEVAQVARLGASRTVSCPGDDPSTSAEEEEAWHSDTQSTSPPTDTDPKLGDESEDGWEGRLTQKMQQRETDGCTLRIGKPSWRRLRDLPMTTRSQTLMLRSWGCMARKGLHYPCMMKLPTPHLTPRGVWPHVCRGCQWTTCCRWRQQLPVEMLSKCMSTRRSWTTSEQQACRQALHCHGRYMPKYIAQLVRYKACGSCNSR